MTNRQAVFKDVTGAILVGGRSRRLGQDKVLIRLDGEPILHHVYNVLEPLVQDILLIGHRRPEFAAMSFRVVEDILPDKGPLGGIFTALMSVKTPFVFVLAGDMPFPSASLIRSVIQARRDADAVIPLGPRGMEPLCAVYSRSCVKQFLASLERGNRRIVNALAGLKIVTCEICQANDEPDPFFNINRPEDLERLK